MTSFAEIKNGKVVRVIVAEQDWIDTGRMGDPTNWIQTSDDMRNKFAGVGDIYDEPNDRFLPRKPFNSWIWNEAGKRWQSPATKPLDIQLYKWNEETRKWEV